MIKLGEVKIKDNQLLIGNRLKMIKILPKLGCDEILTTRITAVTSEVTRRLLKAGNEIVFTGYLAECGNDYGIAFKISNVKEIIEFPFAASFFDEFYYKDGDGDFELNMCLSLAKFGASKFDVDIENIKNEILMKSREELIEEIKNKNQELASSEQFLQSLLGNIKSAIYTKDLDGRYTFLNDECERVTGIGCEEAIGKCDSEIFPFDVWNEFQKNDVEVMLKRKKLTIEETMRDDMGREIVFLTTKVPMIHKDEVIGICGMSVDISERKQMEKELVKAKMVAEDASNAKAQFLANMSHEIRTPMNAIMGMSYLMQKTDLNEKQKGYMDKIYKSSQHLLAIINDILDFSKIEAGKLEIENTEFKLSDVLDNLYSLIGEKCHEKGIELIFDMDNEMSDVFIGDPLRLGQILINFTNNAVKFTDSGEIIVRIRKILKNGKNSLIRFEVEDTGIGIEADKLAALFESFRQADSSTTRRYGGTGLGLAISKNLARLMNGNVGVESEFGKGSTFWFTAELEDIDERFDMDMLKSDGLNHRALVVDDNKNAREVLGEMLKTMGLLVEEADSGEEAIEKTYQSIVEGSPYEIVYMDMQMGGINGITAFQKILELESRNEIHCIMVTNFGREEVIAEAQESGIEVVLMKPVNPTVLYESTLRVLDKEISTIDVRNEKSFADNAEIEDMEDLKQDGYVLLVEDNKLNQEVAREILNQFGFDIDIAENGKEAVSMISERNYDMVLMDMQMPVMDGIEATVKIRENEEFKDMPIIAMTANAMEKDKERCKIAGMNDHISKPIDPKNLFAVMRKWMKESKQDKKIEGAFFNHEYCDCTDSLQIDIDGLDVNDGCNRVMGKQDVYMRILKNFVSEHEESITEIETAIGQGNYESAKHKIHTLKGVSGNIGAYKLQQASSKLESTIDEASPVDDLQLQFEKTESIFKNLIEEIKEVLPEEDEIKIEKKEASPEEITEAMVQLKSFIELKKPKKCRELLEQCKKMIWPEVLGMEFEKLRGLVLRYKYKDALKLHDSMVEKLKEVD